MVQLMAKCLAQKMAAHLGLPKETWKDPLKEKSLVVPTAKRLVLETGTMNSVPLKGKQKGLHLVSLKAQHLERSLAESKGSVISYQWGPLKGTNLDSH